MSNYFKLRSKHFSKGGENFPSPRIYGHA